MTLAATLHKAKAREKHPAFSRRDVRIPMVEEAAAAFNLVQQQDLNLVSCLCKMAGNTLTPLDSS